MFHETFSVYFTLTVKTVNMTPSQLFLFISFITLIAYVLSLIDNILIIHLRNRFPPSILFPFLFIHWLHIFNSFYSTHSHFFPPFSSFLRVYIRLVYRLDIDRVTTALALPLFSHNPSLILKSRIRTLLSSYSYYLIPYDCWC